MNRLFVCIRENKRVLYSDSFFNFTSISVYSYVSKIFLSLIDSKTPLSMVLNNLLELKEDISICKCY